MFTCPGSQPIPLFLVGTCRKIYAKTHTYRIVAPVFGVGNSIFDAS